MRNREVAAVTAEEIAAAQPAIAQWKREQGLPPEYGAVVEHPGAWQLLKRVDFPPALVLPFQHAQFTFSANPATGKVHLHDIQYEKAHYDRAYVDEMAYRTTNCPYCVEGTSVVPLPALAKFIKATGGGDSKSEVSRMVLESWARRVGLAKGTVSLDSIVGSKVGATVISSIINPVTNQGGRVLFKMVLGGIMAGAPLAMSLSPRGRRMAGGKFGRISTLMGVDLLAHGIDDLSQPGSMGYGAKQVWDDLKRAKNSLMGYGPVDAIKSLLAPGVRSRMGGPAIGPKSLIPYAWQDTTGPVVNRATSKPLDAATMRPKGLQKVLQRRTVS